MASGQGTHHHLTSDFEKCQRKNCVSGNPVAIQLDNSEASKVVEKLNAAIAFGESIAAFRGKGVLCEATYDKCPFTGEKMGFAITEVEKIENAV